MQWSVVLELLVNGLVLGSVYALIAIGFNLVWNILAFINFAHGEIYMMGSFVTLTILTAGAPLWVAAPVGILAGGLLGVVMERGVYRPLRQAPKLNLFIAAIGVSIFLQNLALVIWGPRPQRLPSGLTQKTVSMLGVAISYQQILLFGLSLILMGALQFLLTHSLFGKALRAASRDFETASLVGVRVNRIVSGTFFLGSALGAVAGILVAPLYLVYPIMGSLATLKGFTASVVGGMGSISGALLGGLLLGVLESTVAGLISSGYRDGIAMIVLILVLLFKPHGLFARSQSVRP